MKIGILGAGQLGRMFLQEAANFPYQVAVLDVEGAPAFGLADEAVVGDFSDEASVLAFGRGCDVVGIEIEHVNVVALRQLEAEGVRVVPSAQALAIIQDKGLQKQFYQRHGIASPDFYLMEGRKDLDLKRLGLPFVQKLRLGGYDGRGVQVFECEEDLANIWDAPSVIEQKCEIMKEVAVLVACDGAGGVRCYPVVEMVFDALFNQLDYVKAPADLSLQSLNAALTLAREVVGALGSAGLFAVELFIDRQGRCWVNEVAPRVHNSGHWTIEGCATSQFEQMWRILAGEPLGSVRQFSPAVMLNLVGDAGHSGEAYLPYLSELLAIEEVFVHWYGKAQTRAGRKMGHVTILAENEVALWEKISQVRPFLSVQARGAV